MSNGSGGYKRYLFDYFKVAITIIAAAYFSQAVFHPEKFLFFNNVNLIMHEAGHFIFNLFGEFMSVAGGTILQFSTPLAFVIYFFRRGRAFEGSLVMFWLGQSVINISVYMRDAAAMSLPLLGGESAIHDWNYLFSRLDILPQAPLSANITYAVGVFIIILAAVLAFINARKYNRTETVNY